MKMKLVTILQVIMNNDSDIESNDLENSGDAGDLRTKSARLQSNWNWENAKNNIVPNKVQFSGEHGTLHQLESTIDAFKLFF